MNIDNGEEYMLELNEEDLFELTEGFNNMLEIYEPKDLIDLIVKNLTIINKDQGIKVLACEHKVFFNNLFHDKYQNLKLNANNAMIDNFMGLNPYNNLKIRD